MKDPMLGFCISQIRFLNLALLVTSSFSPYDNAGLAEYLKPNKGEVLCCL